MRLSTLVVIAIAAATLTGQASGKDAAAPPSPANIASAAKDAADTLASAAKDKLLVRDLLGAAVTASDGKQIGKVHDLVAIPGGRIVAALIISEGNDSSPVAVPFAVVKISHQANKLGLELPASLSELKSSKEVRTLTKAVTGSKP